MPTARVVAIAASTAFPPSLRISAPMEDASACSEAMPPRVMLADDGKRQEMEAVMWAKSE